MTSNQPSTAERARQAAGVTEPSKELSPFDQARKDRESAILKAVPRMVAAVGDENVTQRIAWDAINALATLPGLVECEYGSFMHKLLIAAKLRLRPNLAVFGHGWILPYKNTKRGITDANWILGYKGMVTIAARSGVRVHAQTVWEGEKYQYERGLNEILVHHPAAGAADRKPIAHYCVSRGAALVPSFTWLWDEEVQAIKQSSAGYRGGSPDNPWRTAYPQMARKSAVRREFTYSPTESPELVLALATDQSHVDIDDEQIRHDFAAIMDPIDDTIASLPPETSQSVPPITVTRADAPAKEPKPAPKGGRGRSATAAATKKAAARAAERVQAAQTETAQTAEPAAGPPPAVVDAPLPGDEPKPAPSAGDTGLTPEEIAEHERGVQEESA